jgi:hypothetical protein
VQPSDIHLFSIPGGTFLIVSSDRRSFKEYWPISHITIRRAGQGPGGSNRAERAPNYEMTFGQEYVLGPPCSRSIVIELYEERKGKRKREKERERERGSKKVKFPLIMRD